MKKHLKIFTSAIIIAACIVFLLGCWLTIIEAGIPFQDPTPEMQIRWASYYEAGSICLKVASVFAVTGILGKVLLLVYSKIGHSGD